MELRGLQTLRTVRTHGGVTAAAAVLHLTPSAVSQQLAALQSEMGVQLTERVGRGLRLTPAGDALADAAVDVAVAVERARAACTAFLEQPSGSVTVSAFQSGAQMLLPGLLTRVRALPGVTLACSDEDVALDDFAALTDRFDVVIAHRPEGGSGWGRAGLPLHVVPLVREPLDLAVPVEHPLARRDEVHPGELRDEDWITVRQGFPVAALLDAVTAVAGGPPRVVHRINDFHVVAALVAAGHGVALLPRYTAGGQQGVRLVPIAGTPVARQVDALLRPDRAERRVVRRVLDELAVVAGTLTTSGST
jgi:DNA-binding transcriptional LysR family regulator